MRRRLVDLLDEAVASSRLTLICAPAGSGKSTLVASWVALGGLPLARCRVSVEGRDTARPTFWRRVARVLQGSLGDGTTSMLRVTDPGRLGALTHRLAASSGPLVLIVDEGGQLPDPDLHRELGEFLARADGAVRLVFVTRADPVLPLHRYRLDHTLSEIRGDDLRFTQTEAEELFARSSVEVTTEQVATLVEKTNGWPAGLMFASSFLVTKRDMDKAVSTFTGSGRAVSDFLIREVLVAQPENVREVLLRSSVADELPVGLFEALTGVPDGHAVLAFLSRANTFISPVPEKPHSYEYSPLFREFLRTRLAFEHPDVVGELHEVAGRWWFDNGHVPQAVSHAVAADDWSAAAGFVVEGLVIGHLLDDDLDPVAIELAHMPQDTEGAPAAIVLAALRLRERSLTEAAEALASARAQLADTESSATSAALNEFALLSVELVEAALAALHVQQDGLDVVRIAERHLSNLVGSREVHPELWGLLATYRACLQVWAGDVRGARTSLDEVAVSARAAQWTAGEIAGLSRGSLLAAVVGDLGDALILADRAREQLDLAGDLARGSAATTALASAWVMTEQCLTAPARVQLARADELGKDLDPVSRVLRDVVRARLLHAKGDYVGARNALAEAVRGEQPPPWLVSWVSVTRRVHAVAEAGTGSSDAELTTDVVALPGWQGEQPMGLQVTRGIIEADVQLRAGDEAAAVAAIQRSLRLASRVRFRRPFTQVPPAVRDLLRRHDELRAANPWLVTTDVVGRAGGDQTVRPFPHQRGESSGHAAAERGSEESPRPLVVEELTAKELEVLGHLAELHTTDEIAAGMFISVNTVRTHVRNILRKLGVDRRNEAVRRAWELGLLASPDRIEQDPV